MAETDRGTMPIIRTNTPSFERFADHAPALTEGLRTWRVRALALLFNPHYPGLHLLGRRLPALHLCPVEVEPGRAYLDGEQVSDRDECAVRHRS
jgi:hypothetical protein